MSSVFGDIFKISTFGESHASAIGVIIDGCPSGIKLSEEDIQEYLDRRRPGQSKFTTPRKEDDLCKIMSGVFEGQTTGTPIMVMVENTSQISTDYDELVDVYRPGHADFTFDQKYGIRDHRGGGRSSGRETIARVIAGAVAIKALKELGVNISAFTQSIGPVHVSNFDLEQCALNPLYMPDYEAALVAQDYLSKLIEEKDSAGGIISCIVRGLPVGIGEPVFDKLDAVLAKAMLSIGAVKGVEFGAGFASASMRGSESNDPFFIKEDENGNKKVAKRSNNSGGVLGGISDGSTLIMNVAVKPTSSISSKQLTVNKYLEKVELEVGGRHDPLIVPRAVVVVEAMAAICVFDLMLKNMSARFENVKKVYS